MKPYNAEFNREIMSLLGNPEADLWLSQFAPAEQQAARLLLDRFQLVSYHELSQQLARGMLTYPASERIAFFVERQIAKRWTRVQGQMRWPEADDDGPDRFRVFRYSTMHLRPLRMYKERLVSRGRGRTKKYTAFGRALPPVDSPRSDKQLVGSEGVVAAIVSKVCEASRGRLTIHPSAEVVRRTKIDRIVVITDFIGSGTRVVNTLESLWRVRSIRSWFSGKFLRFSVFAFSGTKQGVNHVKSHRTRPDVKIMRDCPTIQNSFSGKKREAVETLCVSRSPTDKNPLGFGEIGALIAFEHTCPNNVPAMFFESSTSRKKPWRALFPNRNTTAVSSFIYSLPVRDRERLALETLQFSAIADAPSFKRSSAVQRAMLLVMAALHRGHRTLDSLATVTSMTLPDIARSIDLAKGSGLLDVAQRLTDQGFALLRKMNATRPIKEPPNPPKERYYPTSLRVPFL